MKNLIDAYIEEKTFEFSPLQLEMEAYAREHHVPIISRDSLDLLISLLKIKKPRRVLEFGTAIGYSAILMAMQLEGGAKIISFERNEPRYERALENIEKANLKDRIQVYNMDAAEANHILDGQSFDFVFIDAAKGQYQVFFDMVYDKLAAGAIIVSDNIFHKGLVCIKDAQDVDKRQRTIYRRMNDYLGYLKSKEKKNEFFTSLIPIGDGIAITYKNERVVDE